ncbi:hypothetical protein N8331_00490, partial [bacterium]|nr:hypothetical protein [bacterium]
MKRKFLLFTAISIFMMVSISCDKAKKNIPENMIGDINIFDKESYVINSVDSKIMWKGKELSTKEHFGTMDISNGNISINKNGDINGIIDINMETIDTKDLEESLTEKESISTGLFSISHPIVNSNPIKIKIKYFRCFIVLQPLLFQYLLHHSHLILYMRLNNYRVHLELS